MNREEYFEKEHADFEENPHAFLFFEIYEYFGEYFVNYTGSVRLFIGPNL